MNFAHAPALYTTTISKVWVATTVVQSSSSSAANDFFGSAIAADGNYAVIGAYGTESGIYEYSGAAYIYNLSTDTIEHTLINPNPYGTAAQDFFGENVALKGNYAAVGARYEDSSAGTQSGYIYVYDVTTGTLLHSIANPNVYGTPLNDNFGRVLTIYDTTLYAGVQDEDAADGTGQGVMYVFDLLTGGLINTIFDPIVSAGNVSFGSAIDVSADYIAVGAMNAPNTSGGSAYVYNRTTFELINTVSNPTMYSTPAGDFFGTSVLISGSYLLVTAHQEDSAGGADSGAIYGFDVTTGALLYSIANPNKYGTPLDDYFGRNLITSNGRVFAVGAPYEDDASGLNSGKVYVFDITSGALTQTINNPNSYGVGTDDYFGWSVAMVGDELLIGAFGEDAAIGVNTGKVYRYQY